jgi:membrane-bound ClpP family serine protease
LSVSLPVVAVVAAAGALLGTLLALLAISVHRRPRAASLSELIGACGATRTVLDPDGVVHVCGQLWSAHLTVGQLGSGEPIRVVARHGLVLEVESTTSPGAATQKGATRWSRSSSTPSSWSCFLPSSAASQARRFVSHVSTNA